MEYTTEQRYQDTLDRLMAMVGGSDDGWSSSTDCPQCNYQVTYMKRAVTGRWNDWNEWDELNGGYDNARKTVALHLLKAHEMEVV